MRAKAYSLFVLFLFLLPLRGTGQSDTAFIHLYGTKEVEKGVDFLVTPDSGYVLIGTAGSYGGNGSAYIVRTDSNGNPIWSRTYGKASSVDQPQACLLTPDSGFVVAGYTNRNIGSGYDAWLFKCSSNGSLEWEKTYGGEEWELIHDLALASDSGFFMVGKTYKKGNADVWNLRTDKNGDSSWARTWGDSTTNFARAVTSSSDTTFTWTGETHTSGKPNIFLGESMDDGDTLWTKHLSDTATERAYDVIKTQDGGRALTGSSASYSSGDLDILTVKTSDTGTVEWERPDGGSAYYGASNPQDDEGRALMESSSGTHYSVVGWTKSFGKGGKEMDYKRIDNSGGFLFGTNFFGKEDEVLESVTGKGEHYFSAVGWTESAGHGRGDMCLLLMDSVSSGVYNKTVLHSTSPVSSNWKESSPPPSIRIGPNPTNGDLHVRSSQVQHLRYRLYSIQGELLLKGKGELPLKMSTKAIGAGSYLLRLSDEKGRWSHTEQVIVISR